MHFCDPYGRRRGGVIDVYSSQIRVESGQQVFSKDAGLWIQAVDVVGAHAYSPDIAGFVPNRRISAVPRYRGGPFLETSRLGVKHPDLAGIVFSEPIFIFAIHERASRAGI